MTFSNKRTLNRLCSHKWGEPLLPDSLGRVDFAGLGFNMRCRECPIGLSLSCLFMNGISFTKCAPHDLSTAGLTKWYQWILSLFRLAYCITMFQQCNMTLKLRMCFLHSIYFFMSWFKHSECQQYQNPDDTHTNDVLASLCWVEQVRLNQRDWTLKLVEFGRHVFFIFVFHFFFYFYKILSRQWNFLF